MRVAIVYDCLHPFTIGGGERWYRCLAEGLAARHRVTYLTRRQWAGDTPDGMPPGVEVVAVSGAAPLYAKKGRRRVGSPLRFGAGVLRHLLRHRHRYDVLHVCSFPYFPLLVARAVERLGGPPVVTDWFEVWTRDAWRAYLGSATGTIGNAIQRSCIRSHGRAFVFSELTASRLRENGIPREPVRLTGMYAGPATTVNGASPREPLAVFVGRHIPEKRVAMLPEAIARARQSLPDLRAILYGDGPERPRVIAEIRRLGLEDVVDAPGFVPDAVLDRALRRASCHVSPSVREGYGLAVIEAAARGTPSIVVRAADNAATELVSDGENGFVVADGAPDTLARAIVEARARVTPLVTSTSAWFRRNAARIGAEASISRIEAVYDEIVADRAR